MLFYEEIRHFHMFCGAGGAARGFNKGSARVGNMQAKFRCIGGVDVDPGSVRDFERLSGVPGTTMDLFDRDQYKAFHGCEPPQDWREALPDDIRRAASYEHPHIIFLSPPCKGFSGLLSETKSRTEKYLALNRLTLRGIWLMLEAYADDPVELIVLENVPRIANRGRALLDQISTLLRRYGYAVAETTHDCGELGGLAQSRKRFLLVARHIEKVPAFLYEPLRRPLRAVGDVLGRLPLPGSPTAGPMHRIPALQWKTWLRLAFVEAGSDWRSLNRLNVKDGILADYGIIPESAWQDGALGVLEWDGPAGTVTSKAGVTNGRFSVADPRVHREMRRDALGVLDFEQPSGVITSRGYPLNGCFAVADPRFRGHAYGQYGVRHFDRPMGTVSGQAAPGGGPYALADPRIPANEHRLYRVVSWEQKSAQVPNCPGDDHRVGTPQSLPEPTTNVVAVIRAQDGTWHRPFTTLELAALQSLFDPEEQFELDGLSDAAWRERIGNAVPPDAARAIANVMGEVLLLTWTGETFAMGSTPIWVRPIAAALMAAQE